MQALFLQHKDQCVELNEACQVTLLPSGTLQCNIPLNGAAQIYRMGVSSATSLSKKGVPFATTNSTGTPGMT